MWRRPLDTLRRKVMQRGPVAEDPARGAQVLPLALARAAQDLGRLPLVVQGAQQRAATLAEFVEMIPEHAMIALLDRDGGAGSAVLVLDPSLMAGLIEAFTTGKPGTSPVQPRRATRTDAAILAPFIDASLDGAGQGEGWRYAAHLPEARPLGLLLDEGNYTLWRAELRLGAGERSGDLYLLRPAHTPAPALPAPEEPESADDLSARLGEVEARMDAVLARSAMTLTQIMALVPGDILPLGGATLESIRLTGVDGRCIGEGKLGQLRGMRALRLTQDIQPAQDDTEPFSRAVG